MSIEKTKINSETTANCTDEELDGLVINKAGDKYDGTFGDYFTDTPQDRLLCEMFSCYVLDVEVRNGGFDSFFLNNEDLVDFALEGLLKIGAGEQHALFSRAMTIYNSQREFFIEARNTNLDVLDESYYALEDTGEMRQRFIAANIEKFYD
jgi:hypothetical protein